MLNLSARVMVQNFFIFLFLTRALQAISDPYYQSTCLSVTLSECVYATMMLNIYRKLSDLGVRVR